MRTSLRRSLVSCCSFLLGASTALLPALPAMLTLRAQDPPKVVDLSPPNHAPDVDAKQVKQLVVTFDRPMNTAGRSVCGGGADFPKLEGTPRWPNPKTFVMDVELEPDHDYHLSLNCPSFRNFRSADGASLIPLPWSFTTLPDKVPPAAEQRARNRKALDQLLQLLAEKYSYYDLRVKDWSKLRAQHEKEIVAAKTDASWAAAAARMLAATQDIHMTLRLGSRLFATGTRAVDPLFRLPLLQKYLMTRALGDNAMTGRTGDGIGYLMLGAWTSAMDLDAVEKALVELHDAKALIVDVRPNCGGDETLAQRIAAWFVDGTKTYAKNRVRTGAGKSAFSPVLERQVSGNLDKAKQFRGPIAVLTSRYVMSSNESFVMMLQQAPDCTVVGQPTFGSSGNPRTHELGNGVTIEVPSWQDLRLDGSCFEGEGVKPDVEVAADAKDLEQRDAILERALEVLRAKVSAAGGKEPGKR